MHNFVILGTSDIFAKTQGLLEIKSAVGAMSPILGWKEAQIYDIKE